MGAVLEHVQLGGDAARSSAAAKSSESDSSGSRVPTTSTAGGSPRRSPRSGETCGSAAAPLAPRYSPLNQSITLRERIRSRSPHAARDGVSASISNAP